MVGWHHRFKSLNKFDRPSQQAYAQCNTLCPLHTLVSGRGGDTDLGVMGWWCGGSTTLEELAVPKAHGDEVT